MLQSPEQSRISPKSNSFSGQSFQPERLISAIVASLNSLFSAALMPQYFLLSPSNRLAIHQSSLDRPKNGASATPRVPETEFRRTKCGTRPEKLLRLPSHSRKQNKQSRLFNVKSLAARVIITRFAFGVKVALALIVIAELGKLHKLRCLR